jgi:hypothetical protein
MQAKTLIMSIAFILLGVILFHYYQIAKDTFSMMLNTVYPGRRFSTGGNLINGSYLPIFSACLCQMIIRQNNGKTFAKQAEL